MNDVLHELIGYYLAMWMRIGAAHNISFIFKDLKMNIKKHQFLHMKIYLIKQDINKNTQTSIPFA